MTPLNGPSELRVPVARGEATTALLYPAADHRAAAALILAHSAGAGQRSPFITSFAAALEACYRAVIGRVLETVESARGALFIGGKSMGGRIATQVAAADPDAPIAGLVLLGYPLHPPGQPGRRRDGHLASVKRPMLFVQGSRDTFGTPAELGPALAPLEPAATLQVVEGGDHSFKLPRGGAQAQAAVYDRLQRTVAAWITATLAGTPPRRG